MRTLVAAIVAFAIVATSVAPAASTELPTGDAAKALALMSSACDRDEAAIQQLNASPTPSPTSTAPASAGPDLSAASPSPAATDNPNAPIATPVPPPRAPSGPEQLVPPPLPTTTAASTAPPLPTPTPTNAPSNGPVFIQRVSASPTPAASTLPGAPSPAPSPVETLGPGKYVILSDSGTGTNAPGTPADLDGNVNVIYSDAILIGEHAHYDGFRFIDVTGHPFIRNHVDDSELHADSIRFDTLTGKAILINGNGSTTQGVETGHFYYKAKTLTTFPNAHTHGDRASFTTCERQRAGYHIEAKSLDITPGDKAVAHDAILFLGGFAVFFLPVVVIPLNRDVTQGVRQSSFLPLIGYSQTEGFYVKATIGFAPSNTYYGYYRVDEYTKLGLGLGYVAFFRKKNGRRATDVNFYRFRSRQDGSQQNNFALNDNEYFSRNTKAQFGVNYQGNYGPFVSLPPSYTITGSISHTGERESQNYTFNRYSSGTTQSSLNIAFTDQYKLSNNVSQGLNLSFTSNSNAYAGVSTDLSSLHFNALTHVTGTGVDYDLTFDKTDTTSPFGIDKLPELLIRPHSSFDPNFKLLPITGQFAIGDYTEQRTAVTGSDALNITTQRAQALLTFGPVIAHFLGSDFNASVTATQDAYGTGDLKAQIQQTASLSTPLGRHFINSLTYNESNTNGPQAEPFQTLDLLSGAAHQASDTIRMFNGDVYVLTLQTNTLFNRMGQPVNYQFNYHPSPRSSILLGGAYIPGPGNGFYQTNAQIITPFGRGSDIQLSTNIDWKNKGRLESKNIYYRRVIGDCYELLVGYNQDLKQVTVSVEILAFPSHAANFGLQSQGSIIPGSLNFSSTGFGGTGVATP